MDRKELGRRGEEAAAAYLERIGFEILDTNWRTKAGEVDIVARDGATLVLVEVKTRRSLAAGTPEEAVSPTKQKRLARLAGAYVQGMRQEPEGVRFDVSPSTSSARTARCCDTIAPPSPSADAGGRTHGHDRRRARRSPSRSRPTSAAGCRRSPIVGLADAAVLEARDRVRAALRASGFDFPNARIVVNLAPAPLRKRGTGFDLPIAAGAARGHRADPAAERVAGATVVGELGSRRVASRRCAGLLAYGLHAQAEGTALVGPRAWAAVARASSTGSTFEAAGPPPRSDRGLPGRPSRRPDAARERLAA